MKLLVAGTWLVLGIASAAPATEAVRDDEVAAYEQVKSITAFRGLYSWTAIDDDSLIVWANAFDPYLVELRYPSRDLRFARAIGFTQFGSQIHANGDAIQVRGIRYPIGEIYKLSREAAKQLREDART